MAQETEIKLRIRDAKALRRSLKRLGARPLNSSSGRVHEWNIIFDTPQGGLAKHGQLLRIRTEIPEGKAKKDGRKAEKRVVLTFKMPTATAIAAAGKKQEPRRYKVREEIELQVADADLLTRIFEGLGMTGWFRYEKFRTTFALPTSARWAKGLLIELDETPIGTFVELEGPPEAIDKAAQELGYSKRDYILKNYIVLYVEECRRQGQQTRDMLFTTGK